jgi:acyl-CoA reductase-like NAD-dependent aldehyde dehydrogenase
VHNPANGSSSASSPTCRSTKSVILPPTCARLSPPGKRWVRGGRARHLLNWLDWIVDNQDHILGLVHREAGKSWGDAQIELMVAMEVINYYTKHAAEFLADETRRPHGPASLTKNLRIHYRPYELVGVITRGTIPWEAGKGTRSRQHVRGAVQAHHPVTDPGALNQAS